MKPFKKSQLLLSLGGLVMIGVALFAPLDNDFGRALEHRLIQWKSREPLPEMIRLTQAYVADQQTGPISEFYIAKFEVTIAQWQRCYQAGGCSLAPTKTEGALDQLPMTGINWVDATEYVSWLSKVTGQKFRLPREDEWEFAADGDAEQSYAAYFSKDDQNLAWAANYVAAPRQSSTVKAAGSFGQNKLGLADIRGNVWEWTESCYEMKGDDGKLFKNCGVRIVLGEHRAALADFVRKPQAGGCAAGIPPSNLGLRLAMDI